MARFYLDFHECGSVTQDIEGVDVDDLDGAMKLALEAARDIMSGEVKNGSLCLGCRIAVLDEQRTPVGEIKFREAAGLLGIDGRAG